MMMTTGHQQLANGLKTKTHKKATTGNCTFLTVGKHVEYKHTHTHITQSDDVAHVAYEI